LKQKDAEHRIVSEAVESVRKYPELDPSSEHFNKELSDSINEAVEAKVRLNPYSVSVGKFVDQMMKPYKQAVDSEVGKATENLAKQVSEAALKPNSVRNEEKGTADKSIAELEAEYGIVTS
jgi:predicted glycosyltransferase